MYALVGHDHGVEVGVQALHASLQHAENVFADGVHLGVKFAADHAIAQIDEAGAGRCVQLPWSDP